VPDTSPDCENSNPPSNTFVVPDRFRGPPLSGNGGYVAGAAAAYLDSENPIEVTLRSPIPLDDPMNVAKDETTGTVTIWHGDTLIAEVKPGELDMSIPQPPDWSETLKARPNSPALAQNINPIIPDGVGFHPVCFCCGADHKEGLQVFASPVQGNDQVAAIWKTKSEWAEADGFIPDSFLWTALDCPGQFAYFAADIRTGMLGRMTGKVNLRAKAGEEYLVSGWRIGVEGKKHFAGTAIHDQDGLLLAAAKSVWIGRQDLT